MFCIPLSKTSKTSNKSKSKVYPLIIQNIKDHEVLENIGGVAMMIKKE